MWLTSVQHGGLGDVDGVVPVLDTESGRGLLEFGVRLPIIFFCCHLVCPCSWCCKVCCNVCRYIPQGNPGCKALKSSFETEEKCKTREKKKREREKKIVYSVLV